MNINERDERIKRVIEDIHDDEIDLQPDFQRGEVWTSPKKKLLIDSILRNWHIPPIHVVALHDGRFEVLDGQQRLTAIKEFVENRFAIDGNIEPTDEHIRLLHGKKYKDLDEETKRDFDRFTLKLNEITDYNHGEPSELFHRLNQTVKLTSSEARNAIYGAMRTDIASIVEYMEKCGVNKDILGFSNSRMAYNDMLSRIVVFLENGGLRAKLNDSILNKRYRDESTISHEVINSLESSIKLLSHIKDSSSTYDIKPMLTKASSINWIYIFSQAFLTTNQLPDPEKVSRSFFSLEIARSCVKTNEDIPTWIYEHFQLDEKVLREVLLMYIERSSSRVMSVGSILIRDIIQSLTLFKSDLNSIFLHKERQSLLEIFRQLADGSDPKQVIEEAAFDWRTLDERG